MTTETFNSTMIPNMKAKSFLAFTRQILRALYYSAPIILTGPALACLEGGKSE